MAVSRLFRCKENNKESPGGINLLNHLFLKVEFWKCPTTPKINVSTRLSWPKSASPWKTVSNGLVPSSGNWFYAPRRKLGNWTNEKPPYVFDFILKYVSICLLASRGWWSTGMIYSSRSDCKAIKWCSESLRFHRAFDHDPQNPYECIWCLIMMLRIPIDL